MSDAHLFSSLHLTPTAAELQDLQRIRSETTRVDRSTSVPQPGRAGGNGDVDFRHLYSANLAGCVLYQGGSNSMACGFITHTVGDINAPGVKDGNAILVERASASNWANTFLLAQESPSPIKSKGGYDYWGNPIPGDEWDGDGNTEDSNPDGEEGHDPTEPPKEEDHTGQRQIWRREYKYNAALGISNWYVSLVWVDQNYGPLDPNTEQESGPGTPLPWPSY